MIPARQASALALAALFLVSSCGDQTVRLPVGQPAGATQIGGGTQGPGSPPPILEGIPDAPWTVLYRGTRTVEAHYTVGGAPTELIYREEVAADGQGNFTIVPLDVLVPTLADEPLFLLVQEARQGFFYRYRDFQIRDLNLFLENYTVTDLGLQTVIAGRICEQFRLQRLNDAACYYEIAVDAANSLILLYEELSLSGELLIRMKYESLDLAPDLSDLTLQGELFPTSPLNLLGDPSADLGFTLHLPQLPPTGFLLESAERLDNGAEVWAKLVYGDGAERVIFMHGPRESGVQSSDAQDVGLVDRYTVGPWTMVTGRIDRTPVMLMGKVPEAELFEMLRSML